MTQGDVVDLVRGAVMVIVSVAAPILIVSVTVGLLISILQTTTSIQEQTLTFVPKILAVLGALVYFGFYIVNRLTDYARTLIMSIPEMTRW